MDLIEDISKTYDNLLKNTFSALLIAPNTCFTQFFEHEKMLQKAGKHYDYDTLNSIAKTVYNNICTNKTWNTVGPKNAKILVLHTEITEVKEELKKARDNSPNGGKSGAPDYTIEQLCKEKGLDMIEKDSMIYWYYPHHKGQDYDRLYV